MSTVAVLRDDSVFAGMTDTELQLLAGCLGRRTFAKGMTSYRRDGCGRQLHIVKSGKVCTSFLGGSGREIRDSVYVPGDIPSELSPFGALPRSARAVALRATVILILHRRDLLRCLQTHPNMARSIIGVLRKHLRSTTYSAECLAFVDVRGRVPPKLLDLGDHHGVQQEPRETLVDQRRTRTGIATWDVASRETDCRVSVTERD